MSDLDGKKLWIEHISDVPEILELKRTGDLNFEKVTRCSGAQTDFEVLASESRRFIQDGMKALALLRGFERGQPLEFIVPRRDFPTAALIFRAPSLPSLFQKNVYEVLLLPYRQGLVAACMYSRRINTYEPELQQLHIQRIGCWLNSYPVVGHARGDAFRSLPE